jgi:hypothetical protein
MSFAKKSVFSVFIAFGLSCFSVNSGFAETNFQKNHPRRAQVNRRANREEGKNNAAAKNGKITQKQANKLNREDNAIKREQRADAAANGGHITKAEQKDLNRQENRVNKRRQGMEHRDAANPGSAPAAPANP